jgi:nitrate/TMAO reductase-like tetraheme cytochrome c subunit
MKLLKRFFLWIRHFFFPPHGSSRWVRAAPYIFMGVLTLFVVTGGVYGWDYTNSSTFCGTGCHTMPPEYASYQISPHARVNCVECHLGREFVGNAAFSKLGDAKHGINMLFTTYTYPIVAEDMRPARAACETCHNPDKFSDNLLKEIKHYGDDTNNTPTSIYLSLKIGGGTPTQGQGLGSHWHIASRVLYYATDAQDQVIPYVRVYNADGTYTEYIDITANINPKQIPESKLKEMDCITCHNRVSHLAQQPDEAVNQAMAGGVIDPGIPDIHRKGVEVLLAKYTAQQEAMNGIAGLDGYYKAAYPDYYAANTAKIQKAIGTLQEIFSRSVFYDQKSDWNSHPNNLGHQDFPGCFRCHDGKHLNAKQEAIRLECNLCHSIPLVAGATDFVARMEISRGPEPDSHKHPNWILQHRTYLDQTCALCHTTSNPGGKDNSSFCSNSACHGTTWKFAGFDAPGLAKIIQAQLPPPPPTPTPAPVASTGPTYDANIQPLFDSACGVCHGDTKAGGLKLTTYADAMAGSAKGPVIVAGNVDGSRLVAVQSGQHFANLSADTLDLVKKWIAAGAPEK